MPDPAEYVETIMLKTDTHPLYNMTYSELLEESKINNDANSVIAEYEEKTEEIVEHGGTLEPDSDTLFALFVKVKLWNLRRICTELDIEWNDTELFIDLVAKFPNSTYFKNIMDKPYYVVDEKCSVIFYAQYVINHGISLTSETYYEVKQIYNTLYMRDLCDENNILYELNDTNQTLVTKINNSLNN